MHRIAAATALVMLSGCSLLLSDDLSGGRTANGTNDASADGADDDARANDGGLTDGDLTDSGQPTPRRPVGPLEVTIVNGTSITAFVKGFFEIEFTPAKNWRPSRVLDLGLPGNPNLAPSLFEPLSATIEGQTVANSTDGESGFYEPVDETPVRFSGTTYGHHDLPSGADAKVFVHWTIYASGRVVIHTRIRNDGTAPLALPQGWIHSSFAVDPAKKWNVVEGADKRSATFFLQEPSGLGMTAILHEADGNLGMRSVHERHWFSNAITMAPEQDNVTKIAELQLGVTPEEASGRVADAHAPELGVLSGVARFGDGFDPESGAYRLSVLENAAIAKFELTPVQLRAYPAFEIRQLAAPNGWRLTLDGQTVASSDTPVTPLGVARYSPDDNRLLVVYLGTIPASASTEKRTFTLERL